MRGFEVLLPLGSLYSQEYKSILFHSYILGANIKATASVIITWKIENCGMIIKIKKTVTTSPHYYGPSALHTHFEIQNRQKITKN